MFSIYIVPLNYANPARCALVVNIIAPNYAVITTGSAGVELKRRCC